MEKTNIKVECYEKIIAQSDHYYIKGIYESANLYLKSDNKYITTVGDFYGNPEDGLIDWKERFCITVGYGYIVYYLRSPFEKYSYHRDTTQWLEGRRENNSIRWIERVRQISDNEVELTDEYGNKEIIEIPNLR